MTTVSTFCIAFHILIVAGIRTDFEFGMWVEHSKSQSINLDDKPSLKWAWSRHVIHFKFQGTPIISQE